jgi:uncharacterized membrane protein
MKQSYEELRKQRDELTETAQKLKQELDMSLVKQQQLNDQIMILKTTVSDLVLIYIMSFVVVVVFWFQNKEIYLFTLQFVSCFLLLLLP